MTRFWGSGRRAMYVPDVTVISPVPADRLTKAYSEPGTSGLAATRGWQKRLRHGPTASRYVLAVFSASRSSPCVSSPRIPGHG